MLVFVIFLPYWFVSVFYCLMYFFFFFVVFLVSCFLLFLSFFFSFLFDSFVGIVVDGIHGFSLVLYIL